MSNLTVLDHDSLDSVIGGTKTVENKTPSGSSSSSSGLSTQLAGLQSSIKDLAAQKQPQSLFGGSNAVLLFAVLAMNRPAPAQTSVVYVGRRNWW
ncbi:MAG: hypothetical protein ABI175_28230 [Polyangiales bacterium]